MSENDKLKNAAKPAGAARPSVAPPKAGGAKPAAAPAGASGRPSVAPPRPGVAKPGAGARPRPVRPGRSGGTPPKPTIQFADVAADAAYFTAVDWAVNNGVAKGIKDNEFAPERTCTRAQAVTFLWRALGSPEAAGGEFPFTDVAADSPYYPAVAWASENEVASVGSNGLFAPEDPCTYGQFLTFLWRAKGKPAASGESALAAGLSQSYYTEPVAWADTNKLLEAINGFDPDAACTRAGVVDILYRVS